MMSNKSDITGGSTCEWSFCSFRVCSFASKTPSEVKTLTAGTTSPALASASALFTELKEPYLRTTLSMFHSSFEHSFSLNNPMFWRTLLTTTTVLPLMLLGRMSLGRINRPSRTPFLSVRASETMSFTRVKNGVLFSLGRDWSVQGDEKIFQAQVH